MQDYAYRKAAAMAKRVQGGIIDVSHNGLYADKSKEPHWWTNGFYPGILWLLYRKTGQVQYATWAQEAEDIISPVLDDFYLTDHDLGFLWLLSSVADYKATGYKKARLRGLKAANYLAGRFNPAGQYIRAWNTPGQEGWAIIDCMMNLALLYWASAETGDPRFYHVAKAHATMATREFIKDDGSVYHIVKFDPMTGARIGNEGGQGYSADSSWGRGTAWALYGMAISYKYTKDPLFLETAQKVARFILDNLPADGVPTADYKAPKDDPKNKKDASAGAISAGGFALLYQLTGDGQYQAAAKRILEGLYKTCANETDEALLLHGNAAYHAAPPLDDMPLIYGDYFFMEAIDMLNGLEGLF